MVYLAKGNIIVRDSQVGDFEGIKDNIIPAIIEEIKASHGGNLEDEIASCVSKSGGVYTGLYGDKVICMFGDIPDSEGGACIWMITSNEAQNIKKTFVIFSKFFIKFFRSQYNKIYNYIDVRYDSCIKWMEKCGAKFSEPEPYGKEGLLFKRWEV